MWYLKNDCIIIATDRYNVGGDQNTRNDWQWKSSTCFFIQKALRPF